MVAWQFACATSNAQKGDKGGMTNTKLYTFLEQNILLQGRSWLAAAAPQLGPKVMSIQNRGALVNIQDGG